MVIRAYDVEIIVTFGRNLMLQNLYTYILPFEIQES